MRDIVIMMAITQNIIIITPGTNQGFSLTQIVSYTTSAKPSRHQSDAETLKTNFPGFEGEIPLIVLLKTWNFANSEFFVWFVQL